MTYAAALALAHFALGYFVVLAAPGPNTLAIGVLAALRGFRAVLPFVAGVAAGVGALGLCLLMLLGVLEVSDEAVQLARALGGVLLLLVAARLLRAPTPVASREARDAEPIGGALLGFGAGFCTAVTNPITATYFVAQFLGSPDLAGAAPLAILIAALQALGFGLLVARVFAHAAARRVVLARHRLVCSAAGGALAGVALAMLRPAFAA